MLRTAIRGCRETSHKSQSSLKSQTNGLKNMAVEMARRVFPLDKMHAMRNSICAARKLDRICKGVQ